ncbi:hypothetical protein C0993_011474 [Termitomyces sp. T159_Od127]|nr:hypothetical protein C0993_011474 [Termitomyces sp. T159_Od127]
MASSKRNVSEVERMNLSPSGKIPARVDLSPGAWYRMSALALTADEVDKRCTSQEFTEETKLFRSVSPCSSPSGLLPSPAGPTSHLHISNDKPTLDPSFNASTSNLSPPNPRLKSGSDEMLATRSKSSSNIPKSSTDPIPVPTGEISTTSASTTSTDQDKPN